MSVETCILCGCEAGVRIASTPRGVPMLMCPNCGEHLVSPTLIDALKKKSPKSDPQELARIGFMVRRIPRGTLIQTHTLEGVVPELPQPLERLDLLVRHLAENTPPGFALNTHPGTLLAVLGCENQREVDWLMEQAMYAGWLQLTQNGVAPMLTAQGWKRDEEMRRAGAGSRHAFMAMRYGDAELNQVFTSSMQPAVAATGFELRMLAGPHQTAGSIDNRMRVEIRTSRFMVCDLTHGNRGAYWEAGFAEGIGRPVFYTCRRDVLHDKHHADHPHFDTAHQLIIPWARETLDTDMQALKDAIRATLPAEARMED